MPAPTITGTVSSQATTSETPIDPFSGVTIGDVNAGATDTLSITLSGPGSLSGTGLSVSSGNYSLTGTAAAITSELRALSFTSVDGVPNTSVTTTFTLRDTSSAYGVDTYDSQGSTQATFTGADGKSPLSNLVSDAAGDLFGVTSEGGAENAGTVFEIAKSTGELTTLATFTGANGATPAGGLTIDAEGDLFGTTVNGGADGDGTVFEIAKSTGELTTLATFTGANGDNPFGTVISDAAGDLFGTAAYAGAGGYGTVFEIAKSTGELTTLATFSGANGENPFGTVISDAAGDLFGTTANGGADGDGTVFEIAKSTGELTTLATFIGSNGEYPERGLTIDAAGDLFGTTFRGGADSDGTVFEIVKSTGALITLATFTGANGASPLSQLVSDAAGDLFGTTETGGADNDGTVFEIAKSTGALVTLATFTGADGSELDGGLTINSAGDLFGTTYYGGANDDGTVFELPATFVATPTVDDTTTVTVTDSDRVVDPTITGTVSSQATTSETPLDPFSGVTIGDANAGATDALSITLSGPGALSGTGLSVSSGIYTLTGTAAAITSELRALSFTPVDVVPNTSVTTTFTLSDTSSAVSQLPVVATTAVTDSDPVVTPEVTGGASVSYVAGASPVALDAGLALADAAAASLSAATVSISAGFVLGDELSVGSPQAGIASQYNAATGVLSLSGSASLAAYQTELDSVAYASASATTSSRTITWSVNDGVNASAPATSQVSVSSVPGDPSPLASDPNILWQNTSTGQVSVWEMDGNTRIGGGPVSDLGPAWKVVGTGDFNDDGKSDILWQNTSTGQVSVWDMDGNTRIGGGPVSDLGPTWQAVGTGDFYGNGDSDILFQNTSTGQVSVWEMDGNTRIGGGPVSNLGPAWKVVGTGDFNDDGKSDILWQNTSTGQVSVWDMDGNTRIGGGPVSDLGPTWQAVGTGDFYGNGDSDILFQNTSTGQVSVWEMDGNTRIGGGPVSNLGPSWHAIAPVGGGSDILFQNASTGQTSIWEMDGNTRIGGGPVSPNPGTSWRAVGLT